MKYTEEKMREYIITFEDDPSDLGTLFDSDLSIDFWREFVNTGIDMSELVQRLYNKYRTEEGNNAKYLSLASWIDATEPKFKEFLTKKYKRLWD